MKRIIISCVLALCALGLAIFQAYYVSSASQELYDKLQNTSYIYSDLQLEHLCKDWRDKSKTINMFIRHDNVENVTKNLEEMIEMAKTENYNHLKYLNANTKEQLRMINESESLTIENIF